MDKKTIPVDDAELHDIHTRLKESPKDISCANRYWHALGSLGGWTAEAVVEIFREPALASREGVVALARAQYDLFKTSAQPPEKRLIDGMLVMRSQEELGWLSDDDYLVVFWLLNALLGAAGQGWSWWHCSASHMPRSSSPLLISVGSVPESWYGHVVELLGDNGVTCFPPPYLLIRPAAPGEPQPLLVTGSDCGRATALLRQDAETRGYEFRNETQSSDRAAEAGDSEDREK